MANADTATDVLLNAGFTDIELRRSDIEVLAGRDLAEATAFLMALGPAGEIIRLAGDNAERIRPKLEESVSAVLADYERPDGSIYPPTSTWIVSARAPG
jgi:hypothetical protein